MWNDSNDKIMEIMDRIDGTDSSFPVCCPVCREKGVHLCIHRYDEHHGGIWIWCSKCHSYSHMSGIIPDWWKNMPGIEEVRLEAEPQYLDENNSAIDDWVNGLLKSKQ